MALRQHLEQKTSSSIELYLDSLHYMLVIFIDCLFILNFGHFYEGVNLVRNFNISMVLDIFIVLKSCLLCSKTITYYSL